LQIPRYERKVEPQVNQTPEPSRAVANANSQIRQANQQLGQAVQDWGAMLQKRSEEKQAQQVIDAQTGYLRDMTELSGKMSQERQYSKADGLTNDFMAETEKIRQKYSGTLLTAKQQQAFAQMVDRHTIAAKDAIFKYENEQVDKGKEISLTMNNEQYIQLATQHPENLDIYIDESDNTSTVVQKSRHWNDDQIKLYNLEKNGKLFAAAINAYALKGDWKGARETFNKFGGGVSVAVKSEVEKAIVAGENGVRVENLNFIFAKAASVQTVDDLNKLVTESDNVIGSMAGKSDEAKENMRREAYDKIYLANIETACKVEKDQDKANKILKAGQGKMSHDAYNKAEIGIKTEFFNNNMDSLFDTYKTYKLADGSLDSGRIHKDLEKKFSGDELVKAEEAIDRRISDFERDRDAQRNAGIINGQNEISGFKNDGKSYGEALTWLKKNKSKYEDRDYTSLLNYAQNVFDVDSNGNPRGAGGSVGKPRTDLRAWTDLVDKLEMGELTQNDIINLYNKGIETGWGLSEGDYRSLTKDLKSKSNSERISIIKNKAMLLYPSNQEKRRQFEYFIFNETKGKSILETVEFIEKEASKTTDWFGSYGSKNADTWNADYKKQIEANKLWGIYQNKLGPYYSALKVGLQKIYKTDKIDASHIRRFTDAITGGANEDTIAAIKYLAADKKPVTPANINKIVKDAKFKEKQNEQKKKTKQETENWNYLYEAYKGWGR
jgi:hypothetical protein